MLIKDIIKVATFSRFQVNRMYFSKKYIIFSEGADYANLPELITDKILTYQNIAIKNRNKFIRQEAAQRARNLKLELAVDFDVEVEDLPGYNKEWESL